VVAAPGESAAEPLAVEPKEPAPAPAAPAIGLPRAISYARFSSGSQAKGNTIERQTLAFEAWLERNKTAYKPLYLQDKGISAYKGKNASKGRLSAFLGLIADGDIKSGDLLVVEAIDRLSRQAMLDSFDLVRDILKAGVSILTLENNQTYSTESLNGSAIFALIASLQAAHEYSKRLGVRVAAAHASKRVKARAKGDLVNLVSAPWLKDGKLFEPFASFARRAVELYLKGYGHRQIVIELQEDIGNEPELLKRYGNKLNASTIRKWLKSPELIGDWNSRDGLIEKCLEPLITTQEWLELQREQQRRTRVAPSKANDYELSGIVRCVSCGSTFHTRRQKPKPTLAAPAGSEAYLAKPPILYCNCSSYLKNGGCDNNSTWSYDVLLFVYEYGLDNVLADIHESKDTAPDEELEAIDKEIADLEISQNRNATLFEATGNRKYLDVVKECQAALDLAHIKKKDRELLVISATRALGGAELKEGYAGEFVIDVRHLSKLPLLELRHLLKQFGYQIRIGGKKATLSTGDREEFTLIRRLQKYANAYLVKVEIPAIPKEAVLSNPSLALEASWTKYFVVGKQGEVLARGDTEAKALELLEKSAAKS
jgi:DNA invertase Pin-like site-specific DNA recombinase